MRSQGLPKLVDRRVDVHAPRSQRGADVSGDLTLSSDVVAGDDLVNRERSSAILSYLR
jgi:hypothetical protein